MSSCRQLVCAGESEDAWPDSGPLVRYCTVARLLAKEAGRQRQRPFYRTSRPCGMLHSSRVQSGISCSLRSVPLIRATCILRRCGSKSMPIGIAKGSQ